MDPLKTDTLKLPNMIMCGDHPSVTKTELNFKEVKVAEGQDKDKKVSMSFAKITPSSSRTDKLSFERAPSRPVSEHALRGLAPRARPGDAPRADNRELLQAAIGSFRWPPYLVLAWLLMLAAAHSLHAMVAALAAALPALRKLCKYFRTQTANSWHSDGGELGQRLRPIVLGCTTALLYTILGVVAVAHAVVRWAVEPLASDVEDRPSGLVTKVTDYTDFNMDDVKK